MNYLLTAELLHKFKTPERLLVADGCIRLSPDIIPKGYGEMIEACS